MHVGVTFFDKSELESLDSLENPLLTTVNAAKAITEKKILDLLFTRVLLVCCMSKALYKK